MCRIIIIWLLMITLTNVIIATLAQGHTGDKDGLLHVFMVPPCGHTKYSLWWRIQLGWVILAGFRKIGSSWKMHILKIHFNLCEFVSCRSDSSMLCSKQSLLLVTVPILIDRKIQTMPIIIYFLVHPLSTKSIGNICSPHHLPSLPLLKMYPHVTAPQAQSWGFVHQVFVGTVCLKTQSVCLLPCPVSKSPPTTCYVFSASFSSPHSDYLHSCQLLPIQNLLYLRKCLNIVESHFQNWKILIRFIELLWH